MDRAGHMVVSTPGIQPGGDGLRHALTPAIQPRGHGFSRAATPPFSLVIPRAFGPEESASPRPAERPALRRESKHHLLVLLALLFLTLTAFAQRANQRLILKDGEIIKNTI